MIAKRQLLASTYCLASAACCPSREALRVVCHGRAIGAVAWGAWPVVSTWWPAPACFACVPCVSFGRCYMTP